MNRQNWDDLRFVLAVAQTGSVSAAARRLGVTHATVLRRIAVYEQRFEQPLFEKGPRGYTVSSDNHHIINAVSQVEDAVLSVDRLMHGTTPLAGEVRITSTDSFCQIILPPILADIQNMAPELRLILLCSNAHLDFSQNLAEIAVRPTKKLPENLTGKVAAHLGFGVFADKPSRRNWLGLSGSLTRSLATRLLPQHSAKNPINTSSDSFLVLREMAAAGQGRAVLPSFLGNSDPRLIRLVSEHDEVSVPIWVACHTDLTGSARLMAARQYLHQALRDKSEMLLGLPGQGQGSKT